MSKHWIITVAGYGEWLHEGDEASAEEMRAHKANWERGCGKKRPATEEEIRGWLEAERDEARATQGGDALMDAWFEAGCPLPPPPAKKGGDDDAEDRS